MYSIGDPPLVAAVNTTRVVPRTAQGGDAVSVTATAVAERAPVTEVDTDILCSVGRIPAVPV